MNIRKDKDGYGNEKANSVSGRVVHRVMKARDMDSSLMPRMAPGMLTSRQLPHT